MYRGSWLAVACLGAAGWMGCSPPVPAQVPLEPKGAPVPAPAEPPRRPESAPPRPEPGRVALSYRLDAGTSSACDTEAELRHWVKGELNADPFEPAGPARHALDLVIDRDGKAYRGVFELRDAAGHVLLHQGFLERTCERVVDRFVVLAATVVFAPPESEADCENACIRSLRTDIDDLRGRQGDQEKELRALKNQARAAAMQLTYALSTGVFLTANLTPNVGPGVWVGGELRSGPLALALEARVVLPSRVEVGPHDNDLSEYVGLLVPCGRYLYFFGCGVAGGGAQLNYDSNFSVPTQSGKLFPVLQLGGRIGAEVPFWENQLAVRAWGEVLYSTPSVRFGYSVDGVETYGWDRPDVSGFFGLGLVVKFGNKETR